MESPAHDGVPPFWSSCQKLWIASSLTVAVSGGPQDTGLRLPKSVRCGPSAPVRCSVEGATLALATVSRPQGARRRPARYRDRLSTPRVLRPPACTCARGYHPPLAPRRAGHRTMYSTAYSRIAPHCTIQLLPLSI